MSDYKLDPNQNIDISEILKDLEHYRPRRRGWTWREPAPGIKMGPFEYQDCSKPLKNSVPLPPAHYFDDIDPQPMPVITTEIASAALRMISAACAWPRTTARITSWSSAPPAEPL